MRGQIITVVCTFLLVGAFGRNARIIGGKTTTIREFPFIVSIRLNMNNIHLCSGVIISDKHVLTAAHCLQNCLSNFSALRVFTGTSSLSATEGTSYSVEEIKLHPDYNLEDDHYHHDLGILIIIGVFQFDDLRKPVPLPTHDCSVDDNVVVVGWYLQAIRRGMAYFNLRKATTNITPLEYCNSLFHFPLHADQFCTYLPYFNSQIIDDGGPVLRNGKLVGIITLRSTLFNDNYDVHNNVYRQLDFITSVISP